MLETLLINNYETQAKYPSFTNIHILIMDINCILGLFMISLNSFLFVFFKVGTIVLQIR